MTKKDIIALVNKHVRNVPEITMEQVKEFTLGRKKNRDFLIELNDDFKLQFGIMYLSDYDITFNVILKKKVEYTNFFGYRIVDYLVLHFGVDGEIVYSSKGDVVELDVIDSILPFVE